VYSDVLAFGILFCTAKKVSKKLPTEKTRFYSCASLMLDRGEGIPWQVNYSSWLEQKSNRLAMGNGGHLALEHL
jgi:hypothetical protein